MMRGGGKIMLYITVFICGLSTMGVELSASRLLALFFGTSLYVWTNIIGIIMVSLSVGYFIGVKIADKHPRPVLFYTFTLIAGLLIGLIPFLSSLILPLATEALSTLSYNDFLLSFIGSLLLFAFPTIFLGAVIPFAVRLNSENVDKMGKTSGNIYALSTAGSILGVYLPALALIPTLGTRLTINSFSILLITVSSISLLFTLPKNILKGLFSMFIISFVFLSIYSIPKSISSEKNVVYEKESPYCYLQVQNTGEVKYLLANQGRGAWSKAVKGRFFTGKYWDYFLVATAFTNQTKDVLILGLAAGTTAKSYAAAFPNVSIDGIEIDPLVMEIGKKYFNMTTPNLNPIVADGRLFVKTTRNRYDIIVVDVYRDLTIPYHMVTVEFFRETRRILNHGGVLSVNVATNFRTRIVELVGNTLLQVYPKVYTVEIPNSFNHILFATRNNLRLSDLKTQILHQRDTIPFSSFCLKDDELTLKTVFTEAAMIIEEFQQTNNVFFTDDLAPVEQIIGVNAFFPKNSLR
ncbi:MAG TPA: hypothetical protein ENI45_04355 [Thermoplasmatales archaeon]|nr:hypothetical protein [Thermoplasmatales archaeon]